jgi:hypothetical protein
MGKKSRSESGTNIPDYISESLKTIFGLTILHFFDADPEGSGREKFGSGINILDPATLVSLEIFHSKEKYWYLVEFYIRLSFFPFVSDNVILSKLHWHQCFGSGFNYSGSGSSIFG